MNLFFLFFHKWRDDEDAMAHYAMLKTHKRMLGNAKKMLMDIELLF